MRFPVRQLSLFVVFAGWAGCFQALNEQSGLGSNVTPPCNECHKTNGDSAGGGVGPGGQNGGTTSSGGSSGSGSSSGGSSGGVASSSGGSTTVSSSTSGGASTSGSTGGASGGSTGALVCNPNSYVAVSTVSNFGAVGGSGSPVVGATISELDRNGVVINAPGSEALSDNNGTFELCFPLDTPVTLQVVASGFPTTYIEELDVTSDAGPSTLLEKGLQLIASSELSALSVFLQGTTPLDMHKGMVFAGVLSISQTPPCDDASGWAVGVDFLDGGMLPDGGPLPYNVAYLGKSDLPSTGATVTSSNGYAIVYNVDPTITNVAQLMATNVDGGGPCPPENATEMVTGRVTIGTGSITFAPYFVP